ERRPISAQPLTALRLSALAPLLPVRVIAVLQPPRGIAPDRLDMRARIGRVEHVLIGRRHREALEPGARDLVPYGPAARRHEGEAVADPLAPDRQRVGRDVAQAEAPHRDS